MVLSHRGSMPVAVVTGASRTKGIGAAICRALAAQGNAILFTHWRRYDQEQNLLDDEGPARLLTTLRRMGAQARDLEINLADPDAYRAVLDAAEALGLLKILVNNAAYSTRDGYRGLTADVLDAHYAVNLRGAALLSVEFARRYGGEPGGRMINITSGQSKGPMQDELAYAATKGAIEALTVTLAAELAPLGITVNAVNPGPTDTGWMSEDVKAAVLANSGLGRLGTPEDAARLVAFLAGEEGGWITGQILH
ncbi:MAG: SDR family oxidoreductase, partial [Chloroflexota bacterium]